MAVLKIYNEEQELILVSQEFTGDKGWGLLTDLLPHTTYEEGTYFVSWGDSSYETEKIPVPRFTTENGTNKELVFYFKDSITVKPLSAYDSAVKNGFTGTEQEWVESIKGEPGEKGDPFTYQDFTEEQKQEIKGLDEDEVKSLIDEPFKQSIEDPYYDEITYDKFFDETSKSIYYVVNIPHKDKNGDIIKLKTSKPKEPTTAREVSEKYQPSVIINASVFNTSTLEPSGVQIEDGQIIGDKKSGTLRTLGIKDDNTLVDFTSDVRAQEILDMGIKNTVTAFYPIKNGEDKPYKDIENASSNINERHPRQVIAQKENKDLMFITIEGRNGDSEGMNYDDMYRVCESLGASYAYCLDGGGSTQTLVRGNLINKQVDGNGMKERVVPDFLYVDKKVENKKSIKSYSYDIGKITKTLTEMLYKNSNSKGVPNKVDIITDLDSVKETGLYWVGKSAKGSPGDMSYAIIHFQVYDNAALQLAIPYHESSSNILFRRTVGTGDTNTWRNWRPDNTTTWSGLTFESGWSNYGNGEPGLGYSLQGNKVYIKGTVKGSSSNNIITTLPGDIIPKIVVISPTTSKQGDEYKASAIKINTNGEVEIINPSTEWNLVSLTYPL